MPLRVAALPAAALSTTFLLTSVIDQRRSLISAPLKISTVTVLAQRVFPVGRRFVIFSGSSSVVGQRGITQGK